MIKPLYSARNFPLKESASSDSGAGNIVNTWNNPSHNLLLLYFHIRTCNQFIAFTAIYNEITGNVGTYDTIAKDKNGTSIRKSYEIDFFAVRNQRMFYIQAASDISDAKTRQREIKPYISLNDQIQKIIVINRPVHEMRDQDGFTIAGLTYFLLHFIK